MIQKIQKQIMEWNMIQKGDCIAAAVSGGADSVCLLFLLKELEKRIGFSLSVLHVEHGIRGEESKKDAEFVKNLCKQMKIDCVTFAVDAWGYAKEKKMGLEEAARVLRYAKFQEYANVKHAKIALAHHMEDNAETVLFQMLRGSALAGIGGILPIREENGVCYIRPLLTVHKKEMETYLKDRQQTFCVDATNFENDYSRNYLRNIVMPHLEKVNTQAVLHINQTAAAVLEVRDYMEMEAKKKLKELIYREEKGWYINIEGLQKQHVALQKQVLYLFLAMAAGSKKDIGSVHVEQLLYLKDAQSGKQIQLPYGLIAQKEYSAICLYKRNRKKEQCNLLPEIVITAEMLAVCIQKKEGIEIVLGEQGEKISLKIFQNQDKMEEIPKKPYTKWLDYDKIKQGFCIRMRQSGDYFISDTTGHKKKLKKYFIDEKIPVHKRNSMWLLARQSQIFWMIGGRISEDVKVTEHTKTIIEMDYNGGM